MFNNLIFKKGFIFEIINKEIYDKYKNFILNDEILKNKNNDFPINKEFINWKNEIENSNCKYLNIKTIKKINLKNKKNKIKNVIYNKFRGKRLISDNYFKINENKIKYMNNNDFLNLCVQQQKILDYEKYKNILLSLDKNNFSKLNIIFDVNNVLIYFIYFHEKFIENVDINKRKSFVIHFEEKKYMFLYNFRDESKKFFNNISKYFNFYLNFNQINTKNKEILKVTNSFQFKLKILNILNEEFNITFKIIDNLYVLNNYSLFNSENTIFFEYNEYLIKENKNFNYLVINSKKFIDKDLLQFDLDKENFDIKNYILYETNDDKKKQLNFIDNIINTINFLYSNYKISPLNSFNLLKFNIFFDNNLEIKNILDKKEEEFLLNILKMFQKINDFNTEKIIYIITNNIENNFNNENININNLINVKKKYFLKSQFLIDCFYCNTKLNYEEYEIK